jgi:hypothetical protein
MRFELVTAKSEGLKIYVLFFNIELFIRGNIVLKITVCVEY